MSTFYDIHADDFSKSRFRIWPSVQDFLDTLQSNSKVLDIGCGNGKNMMYRDDLNMIGLESSKALCSICKSRLLSVVQGDARNLPFNDKSFDAIIMIAVIHHINPNEHNIVLNEIKRVLRPGGTCLITNWAVEQPDDSHRIFNEGLNMVTWKGKETSPLPYWVMSKNIANEFIKNLPKGLKCNSLIWDAGNWYFELENIIHP
jgi:tRNA (uracil-5-)-methyltransferase TRM9